MHQSSYNKFETTISTRQKLVQQFDLFTSCEHYGGPVTLSNFPCPCTNPNRHNQLSQIITYRRELKSFSAYKLENWVKWPSELGRELFGNFSMFTSCEACLSTYLPPVVSVKCLVQSQRFDQRARATLLNSFKQDWSIFCRFWRDCRSFWRRSIAPGATNMSMNFSSFTANKSNPSAIASRSRLHK